MPELIDLGTSRLLVSSQMHVQTRTDVQEFGKMDEGLVKHLMLRGLRMCIQRSTD